MGSRASAIDTGLRFLDSRTQAAQVSEFAMSAAKSKVKELRPGWTDYAGAMSLTTLGEDMVRKLAKEGVIDARRLGRRVVLSIASIENYLASLPGAYPTPEIEDPESKVKASA